MTQTPTFREALKLWAKVGFISFGGPAAQIAILQEELVERRGWIDQRTFLTALNFCMLLPGPEAQQLATFVGFRLHGVKGALAAGLLFILPGSLILFGLAWLAAAHGQWPPIAAVFKGLLPVVAALVAHAVWRIGGRILKTPAAWALAAGAFVALQILHLGFPWIILAAALIGAVAGHRGWSLGAGHGVAEPSAESPLNWTGLLLRTLKLAALFATLWAAPFALIILVFGAEPFQAVGLFFTKAAFVTFGGAYAVLPYVAQVSVDQYGWLSQAQMAQGLALAETTPGPLILVTQFVGFFAGWNAALGGQAGGLAPLPAAALAAGLTTWTTFLPCFFFILAGAPVIDRLQKDPRAAGALQAITAAVVGVIATLAVVVGKLAFLPGGHIDLLAILVAIASFIALARWKTNTLWLIAGGAIFGLGRLLIGTSLGTR
jgi:chromate transporter